MIQLRKLNLAIIAVLVMSYSATADLITFQTNTDERLMPLFEKLASAQITSAIILGTSAIVCCLIIKKK